MRMIHRELRIERAAAPRPAALAPQSLLVLPLRWGETVLVRVGERVLLGRKLADGSGDTVPLHAGVSGRVADVAPRLCADGRRRMAVILENDGRDEPDPSLRPRQLVDELDSERLLDLLYETGVRLPGGMPLAAAADGEVHTLIVSAIDPEPGVCGEDAALLYDAENCFSGLRLLERLLRPRLVLLAVCRAQREVLAAASRWTGERLRLSVVPDRYPAGDPRQLAECLGRGRSALVIPASISAACGRAVYGGIPAVSETVSVSWDGGQALFTVPLGAPLSAVLKAAGQADQPALLGGPLTGSRLRVPEAPLEKGMTALTVLPPVPAPIQTACIRCGRCESVCPVGLRPWRSQRPRGREDWSACLDCGACQYSCPAGRPLLRDMGRRGKEAVSLG